MKLKQFIKRATLGTIFSVGTLLYGEAGMSKKEKLTTIKFKNVMWHSIDSIKDLEECSLELDRINK